MGQFAGFYGVDEGREEAREHSARTISQPTPQNELSLAPYAPSGPRRLRPPCADVSLRVSQRPTPQNPAALLL